MCVFKFLKVRFINYVLYYFTSLFYNKLMNFLSAINDMVKSIVKSDSLITIVYRT